MSASAPCVLLATDFSESAASAAEVARAEARQRGARLRVLHVARSPAGAAAGAADAAALAAKLAADVPATADVRVGQPASEIVRYAETHEVDLVVMGGHGRTGATHALLGSVAERVARTSTRPVLMVPAGREAETGPPPLHRCIVCGISSEDFVCEPCRANIRAAGGAPQWAAREEGYAGELDRAQCEQVLRTEIVGHLGCRAGERVYVLPIAYAYDGGAVYIRCAPGLKVESMRESPGVCLQVDHIVDLANWRSVIVWGTFRELHGLEASDGLGKIMARLLAWAGNVDGRPAASFHEANSGADHRALGVGRSGIVARIEVTEMTGRYQQR